MIPPPYLEPLEDRVLLSNLYTVPAGPVRPYFLPVEFTLKPSALPTDIPQVEVMALREDAAVRMDQPPPDFFEYDDHHREDAYDSYREIERELLASLSTSLSNAVLERNTDSGNPTAQSGSPWESVALRFRDRTPPGSETTAQPPALPASALAENAAPLDTLTPDQMTAEIAAPGPFADAVFLDAWRDGVQPPRTELVPAADKDLTIIAAYLVGTPLAPQTADTAPPTRTEVGLTDFIVGLQDLPPARPGPRRADSRAESPAQPTPRAAAPASPDSISLAPPIPTQVTTDVEMGERPPLCGGKDGSGIEGPDTDEQLPSATEPAGVLDDGQGGD